MTRKITRVLAAIKANKQDALFLGNLGARRDWGYAPDYVETMQKMLQCYEPGDSEIFVWDDGSLTPWVFIGGRRR